MPATAPAKKPAPESKIETLPLEERIRRRAYELYVQRGNESGSELDDAPCLGSLKNTQSRLPEQESL